MIRGTAFFSTCKRYRYSLSRTWGVGLEITFVMLNPSTADAETNDPTVAKCIRYSKTWGFHRLTVVNLFALRATNPNELYTTDDPIGPCNDEAILDAAERSQTVVCAWGNHGEHLGRGAAIKAMLRYHPAALSYLKMNGTGHPSHPLYLPGDLTPTPWTW
jgi:hypothetical protein